MHREAGKQTLKDVVDDTVDMIVRCSDDDDNQCVNKKTDVYKRY